MKTTENLSDSFTKNVTVDVYQDHTKQFVSKRPDPDPDETGEEPDGAVIDQGD